MPEKTGQSKMNGRTVIDAAAAKKPVISSQRPVWAARTPTAAPFLRFMASLLLAQDVLASGMSRIGGEGKGLLHLPQEPRKAVRFRDALVELNAGINDYFSETRRKPCPTAAPMKEGPTGLPFTEFERDERYLQGLRSEVSRPRVVIHRALTALNESRALLDRLFPQDSIALRPDRPDRSPQ